MHSVRISDLPMNASLLLWLRSRGFEHLVRVEEPTREQKREWGLRSCGRECCTVFAPDGTPHPGVYSVFQDDSGVALLLTAWDSHKQRARVWHVLSKQAVASEAGQIVKERYTAMDAKNEATTVTPKPIKHGTKRAREVVAAARAAGKARKAQAAAAPAPEKKKRVTHPLVFGEYKYCSTSRAMGMAGWTVDEATRVFAALNPPITPAANSVLSTLRDPRIKPAPLSEPHRARLERMRAAVQKQIAREQAAAAPAARRRQKAAAKTATARTKGQTSSRSAASPEAEAATA